MLRLVHLGNPARYNESIPTKKDFFVAISLYEDALLQWIDFDQPTAHPRQVVVDFGRHGLRYSMSMHELIHWTAYRLDSAHDDYIANHRVAVVLREIADDFYPPFEDGGDCIAEDLIEDGSTEDFSFSMPLAPAVDHRLLDLVDGHVFVQGTFGEMLWGDQEPTAVLDRNQKTTLDFPFPEVAKARYGVLGIRLHTLDLIHWLQTSVDLREMAFQDEELWLDAFDLSHRRACLNDEHRREARTRALHGDAIVDRVDETPTSMEEADVVLAELDALFGDDDEPVDGKRNALVT